jgi:hypothetical protein
MRNGVHPRFGIVTVQCLSTEERIAEAWGFYLVEIGAQIMDDGRYHESHRQVVSVEEPESFLPLDAPELSRIDAGTHEKWREITAYGKVEGEVEHLKATVFICQLVAQCLKSFQEGSHTPKRDRYAFGATSAPRSKKKVGIVLRLEWFRRLWCSFGLELGGCYHIIF